ncbi:acetyltransferase, GNAT family protein [Tritrichomonas foetus]|uniref:Acetyltransferase, GNAT family protein n=1 Tax=Tritrichomonas foetus TaxID=1144522 RepID=A0A1J4J498_9EUKA|nr:acetyltransferase, GNAT family protein [Tritrichomonas foetus]|eukprot:OHS92967.1 acetyltransferase, GNAT family protein [Tritrichomonas foetus]
MICDLKTKNPMMNDEKQLLIRFMENSDIDAVEEFYNSVVDMKYAHASYARLNTPNSTALLLVEKTEGKEKIVGLSTSLRFWHDRFSIKREAYLTTFAIDQKYRNRGLGSFFLNLTIYILSHHYSCVKIMCDIPKYDFDTFEFFKKRGFNGQRICKDFYGLKNGKKENSVFCMKKNDNILEKPQIEIPIEISPDIKYLIDNVQTFGFFARIFAKP